MSEVFTWKQKMIVTPDHCSLNTRTIGEGQPLLLIHGAAVDSEFFTEFAQIMAEHFRVITFDRRGYGNSTLPLAPDGSEYQYPDGFTGVDYYKMQAEDAFLVLSEYTDQPALVLGCSAGALTAMYFSILHPDRIVKLFLHEPPAYSLMRDNTQLWDAINKINECIQAQKYNSAINHFIQFVTASRESKKEMTQHEMDYFMDNNMNYIRNEYRLTFNGDIIPESLPNAADACILIGRETGDAPLGTATRKAAQRLGLPIREMPGSHNGVRDDSADFAEEFQKLL